MLPVLCSGLQNSCVFFVLGVPWFVCFLCSRICASSVAVGAAKLLAFRSFYFSVMLPVFCASTSSFSGFQREGQGEGQSERGHRRRQKERGREGESREEREETERGEGQGRDKEVREREVVKGLRSTTEFHSLETGGLDLTN